MQLQGDPTPLQVLQGRICSLNAISLDRSLSREGFCADARAAGEAVAQAKQLAAEHMENKSNPHSVTKAQVGLGNADNTSDLDKPVSAAQEEAIAAAKKAGTDAAAAAKKAADKAQTGADQAQTAADTAKAAAEQAREAAQSAQAAAEAAQAEAEKKTAWFTASVTLEKDGWRGTEQTVAVPGVTEAAEQPIFVTPAEESREAYGDFGVRPVGQGADTLTFSCEAVPERAISLNIVGFTLPGEAAL